MRRLALVVTLAVCGCDGGDPAPPAGGVVEGTGTAAGLEALLREGAGRIELEGARYEGHFIVPDGVTLVGRDTVIRGIEARPVLQIRGGVVALEGLIIEGGSRGIEVSEAQVHLRGVTVRDTAGSGALLTNSWIDAEALQILRSGAEGLVLDCAEGAARCRTRDQPSRLVDLAVTDATRGGVYARGQLLEVIGGRVERTTYAGRPGDGRGITLAAGARADIRGTVVSESGVGGANDGVGVLIHGPATRARLAGVSIIDTQGRGIWVQEVRGSLDEPGEAGLCLEDDPEFGPFLLRGNSLVGLGGVDLAGIIVMNGRVADTRPVERAVGGSLELVGDGLGFFGGAGEIWVDGLELENNARAQILCDAVRGRVDLEGAVVDNGGLFGVVIQNTGAEAMVSEAVTVPARLSMQPPRPLGIDLQMLPPNL